MDVEPVCISVRFEPAFVAVLDERRRELPDLPNRSELIRRLCEQALANGASATPRGKARAKRDR